MSLNSFALNKAVLNGSAAGNVFTKAVTVLSTSLSTSVKRAGAIRSALSTSVATKVVQAGKIVSYLSTSAVSYARYLTKTISLASASIVVAIKQTTKSFVNAFTSSASVIKQALVTYITWGSKYVTTGKLNGLSLNTLTINTDFPVYTIAPGITSTSTLSTSNVYNRTLAYVQTSLTIVAANVTRVKALLITCTSTTVIAKQAQIIKASVTSSIASIIKSIGKQINVGHVSTTLVVLTTKSLFLVGLSELIASTPVIVKDLTKIPFVITSVSSAKIYFGYFRTLVSSAVISTSKVIKLVAKTFITLGNKYLITGGPNSSVLNSLALNADAPVYTTSTGVTSYSTVSTSTIFYKLIAAVQTTVNTLSKSWYALRTLVTTTVASIVSFLKAIQTTVAASQSSIASLIKPITRIVLLVTTVYSTVVSYVFVLATNSKDIVYVPTKRIALQLASFTSILVRRKKTGVTASKQDNIDG